MSKHLESLYQNLLNGKLPQNLSWAEANPQSKAPEYPGGLIEEDEWRRYG